MPLKRLSQLAIVLSAALYVGCGPAGNQETGIHPPDHTPTDSVSAFEFAPELAPVPDEPFQNASGGTLRLSDFEGRVVLLNLWATWCGPCKHEMPSLNRLQEQKGGKDFLVIALSSDRAEARAVDPFFEEWGLKALEKFYDPMNAVGRALGVRGLPTTLLIDAQGREIGRLEGPAEWDSPEAIALIDAVM